MVADIYIYIYIDIYYLVFFVNAAACDFIKTCPLGRTLTMEDQWLERRTATARTTERSRNHGFYGKLVQRPRNNIIPVDVFSVLSLRGSMLGGKIDLG